MYIRDFSYCLCIECVAMLSCKFIMNVMVKENGIWEFKVIIFQVRKICKCKVIFSVNYIDTGGSNVEGNTFSLPHIFPNPCFSVCFRKDSYIAYACGFILFHMLSWLSGSCIISWTRWEWLLSSYFMYLIF